MRTLERMMYISTYNENATAIPHHSLIQTMEDSEAVEAVYAAKHADLPPVKTVYIFRDDEGLFVIREGDSEWWLEDRDKAVQQAKSIIQAFLDHQDEDL